MNTYRNRSKLTSHLLLALSLLLFAGFVNISKTYAALPIAECKSFLDNDLELLCLENSIKARIEDEINFSFFPVSHSHNRSDLKFISNRLINLSPNGTVNYDFHLGRSYRCNSTYYRCREKFRIHSYNPFIERVLDGQTLSNDDPEYTYFEMKYFVENGKAYVSLIKRSFKH